ncbi:MAG: hypothetical protein GXY86_12720 [Firmicutes bacterium]|nr:hypothetical protein [Bacillota bacterium]
MKEKTLTLPCPVRDLIPQKGKMGFDQILIKTQRDDSESTATIKCDNIFLDDDHQLSDIALIEYVNQLIAAAQGYHRAINGKTAPKGLFVGIQEAFFHQRVHQGDCLTVKGVTIEEVSQVTFVQGVIERAGIKIAELVTKLYEVKDGPEFGSLTDGRQMLGARDAIFLNKSQPPVCLGSDIQRQLYSYMHHIDLGEDLICFKIACPEDFDAFDGHFPGNPILPGITLLEIAGLALKLITKKPVRIQSVRKMKISGMILPNQVIDCVLKTDRENGLTVPFSATFKTEDGRVISRFTGAGAEGRG